MENRRHRHPDGNVLDHDGYQYTTRYTRNGVRYFRCLSFREGCRASGKIVADGEFEASKRDHNHPRSEDNIRERDFRRQLREAAVGERGNLKHIYERIAARNPEGAVLVPFNSVRSSMLRWKRKTTPNIPANLEELAAILQGNEWPRFSTCTNGAFYSGCVVFGNHRAVIFGNHTFLQNFTGAEYVFIDGTFKAVPRRPNFSQILTVFATSMDHAFPIIHIFMERRTRGLYDAVFAYLSRSFPNFVNQTIITDYEVALTASLRASYPQTSVRGCFFHFCQAVLRKAKMLGVVQQIAGNANGRILLRKYYALALLPPEIIIPVFESLQDDNAELNGIFRGLHDYFRRQWIEQVTPAHFTVFKQRHRTNNVMEAYHRRLNSKLVRHPGVWDLMETLIDIQNTAAIELMQLERHGTVFRVAKKSVLFHARLDEAWDKLVDGRYNAQDFLRQAVHMVEGLDRQLHHWNEEAADEEGPAEALALVNPDPPAANQNEPPPLHFFQPQDQRNLVDAALPHPLIPGDDQPVLPQVLRPMQMEPPPLIFFNDAPPAPLERHVAPAPDLPEHPEDRAPSPDRLPHIPSPVFLADFAVANSPERHVTPTPDLPEHPGDRTPSPDRLPDIPSPVFLPNLDSPEGPPRDPSPLPVYEFPDIPEEVGRAFAAFEEDEALPAFENVVVRRWEPTIPATEYEESITPGLLCKVCYLNKVQYVVACGHAFCTTCAETLFNVQAAKCAICRANLESEPCPLYL